jgi:hypothetical protein
MLVSGVAAASASADSLVYVKGGYVYVANADGSGARAVSSQSQWWAWPSESDNGTIAVAGGAERVNPGGTTESSGSSEIYAFDQNGNSLLPSPVETPGSVSSPQSPTYVNHFRISPDGSTVAYNVLGCCGASGESTFVSSLSAGSSDWADFQDDYVDPSWTSAALDPFVQNDPHVLGLSHNGIPAFGNAEYAVYHLSNRNGGNGSGWDGDQSISDGDGYEVAFAPDLRHDAIFTENAPGNGGTASSVQIHLETPDWASNGNQRYDCTITLPAGQFSQPSDLSQVSLTYSSDDRTIAWAQHDGIYEADVSNPQDCATVEASIHLVVPAGTMPYLSAAPLSAAKAPTPPAPPVCGSAPGCSPPPKPSTSAPNTRISRFALNRRTHTLTVRFTGTGHNKLHYQCKLDKGHWRACRSPLTLRHLRRGHHTLAIRAVSATGLPDRTPVVRRFTIGR